MNSYMKETSSRSKPHRPKEATGESQLSNAPKNVKNGCVVVENGPFEVGKLKCHFRETHTPVMTSPFNPYHHPWGRGGGAIWFC